MKPIVSQTPKLRSAITAVLQGNIQNKWIVWYAQEEASVILRHRPHAKTLRREEEAVLELEDLARIAVD